MDVLQARPRRGLAIGAVIAGLLVGGLVQILLMLLGAAVGLVALPAAQPSEPVTQVAYLAWLVASLVASVFTGALVASLSARTPDRGDGLLHGLVVWAAVGLAGVFLVIGKADVVLGRALHLAGQTAVAAAPSPEASAAINAGEAQARGEVEDTVDRLKRSVAGASTGLQVAGASQQAKDNLAIGLGAFLAMQIVLLVSALAGGAAGARSERRHRWVRSIPVTPIPTRQPPVRVPVAPGGSVVAEPGPEPV
jgi:hypothetical protein